MKILTRVVNIKLEPIYDFYIGRRGQGHDGVHGNPFRLNDGESRGTTLKKFKGHFYKRIKDDYEYRMLLFDMKKFKDAKERLSLGCFCAGPDGLTYADKPHICHGQIIAEYIDMVLA